MLSTRKLLTIVCLGVIGFLLLILGIITVVYFDPFVDNEIRKELIINQSSAMYHDWIQTPVVPYLKVYFFNVTNSDEVLATGTKPILQQVGPYSYREHWTKINVTFHPSNGTVTYQTLKHYYFDRNASSGPEDDIINTLNIPVVVAAHQVSGMSRLVKLALSSMLQVLKETAFIKKTVNDLVWGYEDPLLDLGNRFLPPDKKMPFKKFGYYYEKNGSTDGILNVHTGAIDISKYTIIDNFNYSRLLSYWDADECNAINGTDGTSFPPFVKQSDVLYMFNENMCRSLPLVYQHPVERYGIQGMRFAPPTNVFATVEENPSNECFCVGGPPCMGGGIFNISACKFNTPTVLSWPHFFQAHPKYLDAVVGLSPDSQKHQLYVDIAPRTGAPLAALARLQINFQTTYIPEIQAIAKLPAIVFPTIWFEDGVEQMNEDVIALLQRGSNFPVILKTTFLSVFFVLGGCLLVCIFVVLGSGVASTPSETTAGKIGAKGVYPTATRPVGHSNPVMNTRDPDALDRRGAALPPRGGL